MYQNYYFYLITDNFYGILLGIFYFNLNNDCSQQLFPAITIKVSINVDLPHIIKKAFSRRRLKNTNDEKNYTIRMA